MKKILYLIIGLITIGIVAAAVSLKPHFSEWLKKMTRGKDLPPQIVKTWTDPAEGKVGEKISLCFRAKDDYQVREVKFYADPLGNTRILVKQPIFFICLPAIFEKEGEFSFEVQVRDDAGQWSEKISHPILIKK